MTAQKKLIPREGDKKWEQAAQIEFSICSDVTGPRRPQGSPATNKTTHIQSKNRLKM